MSTNRAYHRAFTVFALLTALALASLPAGAQAVRRSSQRVHSVAVLGDGGLARIWRIVASLLPGGLQKEGMTIDPNGAPGHQGAVLLPSGTLGDEGPSIDPNGRQ
jgi:hypothetical protein